MQLGPSSNLGQDEVWLLLSKHTDDGVDQEFFTLHVCEDTNSQRTGEDGPVSINSDLKESDPYS